VRVVCEEREKLVVEFDLVVWSFQFGQLDALANQRLSCLPADSDLGV
jgi:hypothetical protein